MCSFGRRSDAEVDRLRGNSAATPIRQLSAGGDAQRGSQRRRRQVPARRGAAVPGHALTAGQRSSYTLRDGHLVPERYFADALDRRGTVGDHRPSGRLGSGSHRQTISLVSFSFQDTSYKSLFQGMHWYQTSCSLQGGVCAAGVGVITPYRHQQNMIRKLFRNYSDTMVCPFMLTSNVLQMGLLCWNVSLVYQ